MIAVLCFIAGGVVVQAAHWASNIWYERVSGERGRIIVGAVQRMAESEALAARRRAAGGWDALAAEAPGGEI